MGRFGAGVSAFLLVACTGGTALAAGNAERGGTIAGRWCASCHLVGPGQTSASADVPTFAAVAARSKGELGWLEGFLADPHPAMPDMSLTRQEIRDLAAYIGSLD
ncbi:c-type cytochrome [Propylenella binzhouense]|uniref:C-type cytochrome n=1 Tax=Propylenella binzhouense TaxID=2555902 RepID=A0A964WUT4_9HYPH|nr:c-type cytochrome [Propylenella binzhouense]MYZ49353.1 c-type cytochrome [Propylenella binzhouense]